MMGKKDYQLFADAISLIEDEKQREGIISFLNGVFYKDNNRYKKDLLFSRLFQHCPPG